MNAEVEKVNYILKKYPDRIPVYVEKSNTSTLPELDRKKYLCPKDLTVGSFLYVIRKKIKLSSEKALFMYIDNKVLPMTASNMSQLYDIYKNEKGFLYFTYCEESTFG